MFIIISMDHKEQIIPQYNLVEDSAQINDHNKYYIKCMINYGISLCFNSERICFAGQQEMYSYAFVFRQLLTIYVFSFFLSFLL